MALEDELSCAVCTELFRDPVVLVCGHSYCGQCIGDHWSSSGSRNCPVCRQVSAQPPLPNLSLRNACETFIREQNNRTETDREEEHECPIHGEKIQHFCLTDEESLCATCKKQEHAKHKTQPLQQAVQQRKEKLKAALRPLEKTLWSLQNAPAQDAKIYNYNHAQVQQTERRIREEFKKLHQFLKTEEESRITALNEEEKQKRGQMEKRTKGRIRSLTNRLREVEDALKSDDITFLQNYNSIMNRAKYTLPDQEASEALIDIPKHLGNLKYDVWDNMKDFCPYYPVILNPNSAFPDVSVSDDLTSVTSSVHCHDKPNTLLLNRSRLVLGSVGYGLGTHTWEVEVGKSRRWSLGVCFRSEGKPTTQALIPAGDFWGLRRDGCMYGFVSAPLKFRMKTNPEVVQVRLEDSYDKMGRGRRKVTFSDARSHSHIANILGLPVGRELFPFVMPEDQIPLRFIPIPAKIFLSVEEAEHNNQDRYKVLTDICFWVVIFILVISAFNTDRHSK